MKKPTWITAIGIAAIIFGVLGLLGASNLLSTPTMMEFQKEMFSVIGTGIETEINTSESLTEIEKENRAIAHKSAEEIFSLAEKMVKVPEWFSTFCLVMGIIGMCVSGFMIFAGIFFLMAKPKSVKVFYVATITCIAYALIKAAFSAGVGGMIAIGFITSSFSGIIIHVILAVVVMNSDKSYFKRERSITLNEQ